MKFYSVFSDASFCERTNMGFVGVVIMDMDGKVETYKNKFICTKSSDAELLGVKYALSLLSGGNVTVFCDCKSEIEKLLNENNSTKKKYHTKHLNSTRKTMKKFENISVEYLKEEKDNFIKVCHDIANKYRKSFA